MRIAVGGVLHETSTFLPFPTTLADFAAGFGVYRGDEIPGRFAGSNMCIGGFLDAAREHNFTAVPLLWGFAYPSGVIPRADYLSLRDEFLARLRAADAESRLDGVLLDLHGAMVVEGIEDGDGDFVAAVRQAVGPERPIIVCYDLHGNHTATRMHTADASIGYDTYPHADMAERGREAGALMARTVRGEVKPVTAWRSLPMFWSAQRQVTAHRPMNEVLAQLHAAEKEPDILTASVSTGFPWADIENLGAGVFVVANGDRALAQRTADRLATWIWERRECWYQPPDTIEEGLSAGEREGKYPIILGDFNDNTGGGAPGDSTAVLRTFVDRNLPDALVLYLVDPEVVQMAHRAGVGARFS